ncbi:MAG: hypothetical protein RLZZ164_446 [Actinomycetota bacterium]|jgi:hypothetical protein
MKKIALAATTLTLATSLSGCALLYPHWGTTDNPGSSASSQPSSSASASASASASDVPKKAAKVQIDSSSIDPATGMLEVWAQATNFNEDGGLCTLTIQAGTTTKTVSAKASSNVTSTQCYALDISTSGLPKGTALITVSYDSAEYAGSSAGQSIVIN